jgi:hypothetical protein
MSKHIGRSVRVFWENDQEWFHGVIDDHNPDSGWHVQYFDGDEEWLTDINDANLVQFEDNVLKMGVCQQSEEDLYASTSQIYSCSLSTKMLV